MRIEITELLTFAQFLLVQVDAGQANAITRNEAVEASNDGRISKLIRDRFGTSVWMSDEVASLIDEDVAAHNSGNSPGQFGGEHTGVCLMIGWTLETAKLLSKRTHPKWTVA